MNNYEELLWMRNVDDLQSKKYFGMLKRLKYLKYHMWALLESFKNIYSVWMPFGYWMLNADVELNPIPQPKVCVCEY